MDMTQEQVSRNEETLQAVVLSLILGCILGISSSRGDFAPNMSFHDANTFFKKNRLALDEMVRELKTCPGLEIVEPIRRPDVSIRKCADGTNEIPTKVAQTLHTLNILWATVNWGKYREPQWDPLAFVAVNFVLQSQGRLRMALESR